VRSLLLIIVNATSSAFLEGLLAVRAALTRPASASSFFRVSWFRQKKFHSFQRQLNIYGFARLSTGKIIHEFIRGWTCHVVSFGSNAACSFPDDHLCVGPDKGSYYHEMFLRGT
jgi:HSF-type DNA-binding